MVIGVFINALVINKAFNLNITLNWAFALAVSTWIIYLLDHLLDNIRLQNNTTATRHAFIKQHTKIVWITIGLLLTALAYLALTPLNIQLIAAGAFVTILVFIHLLLTRINPHKKIVLNNKEFGVAIIYAAALFSYPLMITTNHQQIVVLVLMCFAMVALTYQNLLLCSILEYPIDVHLNNSGVVRNLGIAVGKLHFWISSLSGFVLVVMMLIVLHYAAITYAIILLGHIIIYIKRKSLLNNLWYRKLAELLYWIPAVYLLF